MMRCRARKFTRLQSILGSCLACIFLSWYLLTAKPRAVIEPRVFVYETPENVTASYCARTSELGRQASVHHVGLLLTKDDGDILFEWLEHNSCHFSALLVLDGSSGPYAHNELSSCANVVYYHENDFSDLKLYSDGELRELGHDLISKHFGYNIWITMAHTDEFFIHSPLSAIDFATKENADHIRWRALHVLPHPSEFENFTRHAHAPVHTLFRHYHHYGPKRGSFLEHRTFFSTKGVEWDKRQGALLPRNLKKTSSIHPSYLHYKVHNLSLSAYDEQGTHRQHWNRVAESSYSKNKQQRKGVGIFWSVKVTRDFFVSRWPGNERYSHVSVFHDRVESYLDIGDIFIRKCQKRWF